MSGPFTGRHMLVVMLAFFGVVIAVNLVMAGFATRTFGGKVVENSYVASQKYNGWLAEARAQKAAGWTAELTLDAGRRAMLVAGVGGGALAGAEVKAVAQHPVGRAEDIALAFDEISPGVYRADRALPAGRWIVHIAAAQGGREYRSIKETL